MKYQKYRKHSTMCQHKERVFQKNEMAKIKTEYVSFIELLQREKKINL